MKVERIPNECDECGCEDDLIGVESNLKFRIELDDLEETVKYICVNCAAKVHNIPEAVQLLELYQLEATKEV